MPRRLNTIIIVPHSKAKFFKFSISTKAVVATGVGVAVALVLSIFAIGYSGSAVSQRAEVHRLRAENTQLGDVNERLEQTISEVQGRVDTVAQGDRMGSGGLYDRLPGSPEILELQGDWISTRLSLVENTMVEQDQILSSTPSIAPVLGLVTDGFGRRPDPFTGRRAFHRGLDISARRGTPIVAPADGIVVFAGRNGGLGKTVRISHGFGFMSMYGHLDKMLVAPGDEVRRGDEIGLLGNSGRSTGPHLHYEVHVDGKSSNPLYYILNAY
jgi:murein DD-endopeptidase MepM/ murein hydrolase activator NlpD